MSAEDTDAELIASTKQAEIGYLKEITGPGYKHMADTNIKTIDDSTSNHIADMKSNWNTLVKDIDTTGKGTWVTTVKQNLTQLAKNIDSI